MQITVIGQGYVGLPLAIAAAEAGYKVFGFDSNSEKIARLQSGKSVVEDVSDDSIVRNLSSNLYFPTTDHKSIGESEVVLICVPTPISKSFKPNLESLLTATSTVGKNLREKTLVIIESTIEPGTCRNILLPILLSESGLKSEEFGLAYSPERIDPSSRDWNITNTPKLVAGLTERSSAMAKKFYKEFVGSITECVSLEVAETAKLLENSFRFVNITFINELAIYCEKTGIDIRSVIEAASTKPFGFMPFFPSVGVGGHCIPVDPMYLANAARVSGVSLQMIELAHDLNQKTADFVVYRAEKKIGNLNGKRILVIGVAYKPNVADVRETPVALLMQRLKQNRAFVFWHDDLVKVWNGENSTSLSNQFDLAIIATLHDYIDLTKLGKVEIVDTRSSL